MRFTVEAKMVGEGPALEACMMANRFELEAEMLGKENGDGSKDK